MTEFILKDVPVEILVYMTESLLHENVVCIMNTCSTLRKKCDEIFWRMRVQKRYSIFELPYSCLSWRQFDYKHETSYNDIYHM